MVERRKPIKVNQAIERVMEHAVAGEVCFVPIEESYGHFLGEDLIADHDVPPFDRSPYDGYAIRSQDTYQATRKKPVPIEVIGKIGAGDIFSGNVGHRQAVRIMTGAKIPDGCDAVIMQEMVREKEIEGRTIIELKRKINKGDNISVVGEDTKKGTVLVSKGTYIHPGIVAV